MAEKNLRDLERTQLIELIQKMTDDTVRMEKENSELRAKLSDRTIRMEKAGSIAEASLAVNDVFYLAQNAADEYVSAVKDLRSDAEEWARRKKEEANREADEIVEKARRQSELLAQETQKTAREYLSETVIKSRKMITEAKLELETTKEECAALKEKTDRDIKEHWAHLKDKVAAIMSFTDKLKEAVEATETIQRIVGGNE